MSEPIMQMIDDFVGAAMAGVDSDASIGRQHAAIEREVAALREELRIQDEANNILTKRLEEAKADVAALISRKIDLEAERAALMAAGKVAGNMVAHSDVTQREEYRRAARAVFQGTPGALAAWMGREEK